MSWLFDGTFWTWAIPIAVIAVVAIVAASVHAHDDRDFRG